MLLFLVFVIKDCDWSMRAGRNRILLTVCIVIDLSADCGFSSCRFCISLLPINNKMVVRVGLQRLAAPAKLVIQSHRLQLTVGHLSVAECLKRPKRLFRLNGEGRDASSTNNRYKINTNVKNNKKASSRYLLL